MRFEYMDSGNNTQRNEIVEMKRRLGIDRLVLQVQAASFPMDHDHEGEDFGIGSPYDKGADRLLRFAAQLGFDAIQLGPMGLTERGNPSPYNATVFSRNPLHLPLSRLIERGCLSRGKALQLVSEAAGSAGSRYPSAIDASRRLAAEVCAGANARQRAAARRYLEVNASWLLPDALYDVLCAEYGADWWGAWGSGRKATVDKRLFDAAAVHRSGKSGPSATRLSELRQRHARTIEDYALIQMLLAAEHRDFRKRLAGHGLALFGDLQIGISARDIWAWKRLFRKDYLMGAPPSRTNREGQPWGNGVFDPRRYGSAECPGPILEFIDRWLGKMLDEYDGIRIDHPHGWVDPWVYRSDDVDAYHAVGNGARLFSTPDDPAHPRLRSLAIVRPDQIDQRSQPYADDRVKSLTERQAERYAFLFDAIVRQVKSHGRNISDIVCEVLSTLPYPVRRVMDRYGLGRFRVAQKIDLCNRSDVYRIEHARPEDWVMLGTHDTPGIWPLAAAWRENGTALEWGRYLAPQLVSDERQAAFAASCAERPGELVHALFAALLGSRAGHVLVFFPDLLGMNERFNRPGIVDDVNWMLRIPADFERRYRASCADGTALDIHRCLKLALEGRISYVND
jgi:4-alpha-glucanotransferase